MSDTIRESIIASITTALADIRTASGYNTDAGRLVRRGIPITDQDQMPALSVLPLTEENEPLSGRHYLAMRFRVDGIIKYTSKNPSVVGELLLGDIIKRMTNRSLSAVHGGYADQLQYVEGGIEDYPEPGQYSVAVYATFEIKYKTNLGDPYNQ